MEYITFALFTSRNLAVKKLRFKCPAFSPNWNALVRV